MMKRFFTSLLFALASIAAFAQDPHFTQFYSAPLLLNPGLTGAYDGRYRFSAIYRDQWRNALDNPYVTYAGLVDVRFPLELLSGRQKDAVAIGVSFMSDKVSEIDLNTNQISLSAAFHKSLNSRNTHYLSLGIQGGLFQRNVNYEDLTFHDQYNGTNGYTNGTNEFLPPNNFAFSDYAVGLNYAFTPKRFTSIFVGAALHHIFEPQMSFFLDEETPNTYEGSKLFKKYTAHFSASIPLTNKVSLLPRVMALSQGPHFQVNAGSNVRLLLDQSGTAALHVGTWARPVKNYDNSISLDAVVVLAGIEYNNILLGVSYDANLNDLRTDRRGQGALEISIAYLGNYDNETILCPKF
jgi:type IX secretion system PorP/SprF family membrane protein